jgi:hypothetical protein
MFSMSFHTLKKMDHGLSTLAVLNTHKMPSHKIGGDEVLHIHNWDTWSIEGKEGKIAVVTSFEIF